MVNNIKKFFKRKKDAAARLLGNNALGEGHALNEPSTSRRPTQEPAADAYVPLKRGEISEAARAAATAALARTNKSAKSSNFGTSLAAVKAQAKRELEAEVREREASEQVTTTASTTNASNTKLACQGVFYRCPLISDEILSREEWRVKIEAFLYEQLELEPGLTACLIIANCNERSKAENCVDKLKTYLENLIREPDEHKFRKIRKQNKTFGECVLPVKGALEFLRAAGFRETEIDGDIFLVWSPEHIEQELDLPTLLDALQDAAPIQLELDRNIHVLLPSQAQRVELPKEFYRMTAEEVKREQQRRAEINSNSQILRTKAMRDKEEQRLKRIYRYSLVRVRFPNGMLLQGTFNPNETLSQVVEFLRACLHDENLDFKLYVPGKGVLGDSDMEKTLEALSFLPTAMLNFSVPDMKLDVARETHFLKEQLILLVEDN